MTVVFWNELFLEVTAKSRILAAVVKVKLCKLTIK